MRLSAVPPSAEPGRWEPPSYPDPVIEERALLEARDLMGDAAAVAEAFDDAGQLMPSSLADLVVLASQLPARCPAGIRDALFGTIGEQFVAWVEQCLAKSIEADMRRMQE